MEAQQQQQHDHMAVEGYTTKQHVGLLPKKDEKAEEPPPTNEPSKEEEEEEKTSPAAVAAVAAISTEPNHNTKNSVDVDVDVDVDDQPGVGGAVAVAAVQPDDLILNSLEDLMRAAGQKLPEDPTKIDADTKMIEADLKFSVMTQVEYNDNVARLKREQEEEQEEQMKIFMGDDDVFGDESNTPNTTNTNSYNNNADDDDDDVVKMDYQDSDDDEEDEDYLELLMEQPQQSDDEEVPEPQPRAFRKFWDALTDWITHEAVQYVASLERQAKETNGDDDDDDDATKSSSSSILQQHSTNTTMNTNNNMGTLQVDRSDIGASRCAGLMAMVKLYLPSILVKELKRPPGVQRVAEQRLANLLRTFNYSREAPKLGVKLWKAMTCIFLEMVLVENTIPTTTTTTTTSSRTSDVGADDEPSAVVRVPPSVTAVGMTKDEYTYLTRKAIQTFVAGASLASDE
jgi:hypothetical protein